MSCRLRLAPGALLFLLCACGGVGKSVVDTEMSQGQPGYQLTLQAIGCWFGGMWAEAEGFPAPDWRVVTERRCQQVLLRVHGNDNHLKALRALEPQEIEDVAQKAGADAGKDQDGILKLLRGVGESERETLLARLAANKVRHDLRNPVEATQLSEDEAAAVTPLRRYEALERLAQIDLGDLSGDAHTLAILSAMDRMRIVRGLPKHLKIYAMEGVGKVIFGVAPPDVPTDATKPLQPGVWLTHLSDIARAAGYPVPETVTKPVDRELLAWSGVLKGFADKLKQEQPHLSRFANPTLRRISTSIIERMNNEYGLARKAAKLE